MNRAFVLAVRSGLLREPYQQNIPKSFFIADTLDVPHPTAPSSKTVPKIVHIFGPVYEWKKHII